MKDQTLLAHTNTPNKPCFAVGDAVVYRAEGVCDVVDIRNENFGARNDGAKYYILSPRNDSNSMLYVPVDNETLTALMRPILKKEEIFTLVRDLRGERLVWIPDSRARNTKFREILSLGDRREVIVLLQTVREHIEKVTLAGKKPGSTETNAMYRATKLLRDEFSMAFSMTSDEDLFALLDGDTLSV